MGRRIKQSVKRRAKHHKTMVLKLRKRKNRMKARHRRGRSRAAAKKGGKHKKK